MSQLSVLIEKIEAPLAQIVLAGTLSGSIGKAILAYIESTPGTTEADVDAYINANIETLVTEAISKLPSFEQGIADVLLALGLAGFQSFINTQVNKGYQWAVSQLSGTEAGQAIIAQLATVPAGTPADTQPAAG